MRLLYRFLTLLLTPMALLKLQQGETRAGRWRERLGQVTSSRPGQIWVHAASVGEVNAARDLIEEILSRHGPVLVSTMTVTGAERCRALFGERVEHVYLPLDNPIAVRRWLASVRPRVGLIIETEIWPELFNRCKALQVPLILVSARLSPSAMKHYRRFVSLYSKALEGVELACCQTAKDAERLKVLGLGEERLTVTGNLKFDIQTPADAMLAQARPSWARRPIWTAGSTRPGEETQLIAAHQQLLEQIPDALMILAPRHPERGREISRLLDSSQVRWCRFEETPASDVNIALVDQLGVLTECYAMAQVAFVGGSLVNLGGHNLLEPAALGMPVLAGPFLDQQADSAKRLQSAGGLIIATCADEIAGHLAMLLSDPDEARRIGSAARDAVESGRGALDRTLAALDPLLGPESGQSDSLNATAG
ncbi:MAG: 3-deoxy-D-manno-octulosonic acid transferase [Wenzhouxiangella sp.]|jgi:3-deoxy-D-manno-octulosonic-acid transferase|nr:3-deoxy-D-manno-octulosonic acid transferase [Wenzhouxiangella sp.]